MIRLFRKLKLKQIMAWLLVLCTVMSTFVTSISQDVRAANSNTRRMTMLQLGNGESLSSIDGMENIDEGSLQILALYLSNFYIPFITILDGDFDEEDSNDSANKEHLKHMENALSVNCGMNKHSSEFLVKYVLAESLSTCSPLYVNKDDLKALWTYADITDNVQGSIGFNGSSIFNDNNLYTGRESEQWGLTSDWWGRAENIVGNTIGYYKHRNSNADKDGFELYCKWAGTYKNPDGVTYVKVTYPIFLSIMDYSYRTASHDTTSDFPKLSGTYDITNRTDANPDEDLSGIDGDTSKDPDSLTKIRRCNFYFIDGGGTPHIVFSNSEECMQAYAMVNANVDYEHGWGNAFSMLAPSDVDAIETSGGSSIEGTCVGAKLYVNWEGSLIMDTGVYRTPILPGCANPHMLTTVDNTNDKANTVPMQNVWGVQTAIDGNLISHSNYKVMRVYSGDYSLFNTGRWTKQPGTSETDFDKAFFGWGDADAFKSLLDNTEFFSLQDVYWTDKWLSFPNWHHIANSSVYSGARQVNGTYTSFAHRELYGHTVLNDSMVFYDDLSGFDSNSSLKTLFPTVNLSNSDFMSKVNVTTLDTYATFKNITDLGHTATYSQSLQKFFRSLFFTYCFAYFNKDEYSYDSSSDTMLIDLKMNPEDFPTYNNHIDWSSLYADSIQDQVLSFAYYVLHPTEGINYVATLLKNKVGGFLLRCHDDMVGSSDSNSSTGMTRYLSTSSYVSTSSLYDVEWLANLLNIYDSLIVYMIIIMCLILLCYIIVGSMTLARGITGVLIFALLSFIPPTAINATVDIVNTFSDRVYSNKFDYWALSQLETWLYNYSTAIESKDVGDFSTYAAFVLNNQALVSSGIADTVNTTYSGTKVKWMTPKRYSSLSIVANKLDSIETDALYIKSLMLGAVNSASSGETYIDSDNALYLYRDYTDIYRYGSVTYNLIDTFNFNGTLTDLNKIKGSRYWNLVSAKTSGLNTIYNAWKSSNSGVNSITSDMQYVPYLLCNTSYKTSDNTTKFITSSVRAIENGFLANTVDYNGSAYTNKNYFYDINNGHNQTLALTYLSLYNDNVLRVHQKYKALQNICNGTTKLQLDDDVLKNTSADTLANSSTWIKDCFNFGAKQHSSSEYADLRLGYNELINGKDTKSSVSDMYLFRQLSSMYYSLYSESPFYYFNNNIRDQVSALTGYNYSYPSLTTANANKVSNTATMLLGTNQDYFYNLTDNAGDGYGEMRDFMNMHDLFYYIIPMLRDGVDLARLYDETFGLYIDDDCALSFNIGDSSGYDVRFTYSGVKYDSISDLSFRNVWKDMNEEERYKFWHSYNTYTILLNYTAWLDTMMDCNYADSETISIMGDRFTVTEPLNPYTYFETDSDGNIIKGRLMVFSRSEMAYYGLTEADLTTVEQKIIDLQDNVYAATLDIMNYYTLSDETLIQAYAMIQTFEFNKMFSQDSLVGESFVMFPQGYELKGFSYDAYLRMIIAEASGEPIMTGGGTDVEGNAVENTSIYKRVLENTSLFFALFLLINDILAVYLIPGLKLFFIVCIFITSVLIIIGSAIKMELNMFKVMWQSLFAPLLSFAGISMGMSLLVSMFMGDGTNGVVSSSAIIDLGDPTATIIVMIIINAGVTILYFKVCKKCFHDLKTYGKAIFDNIGSTVVGAVGTVTSAISGGSARDRLLRRGGGSSNVAGTAKQRGQDNMPSSGKTGVGTGAIAGGALGAGMASDLLSDKEKLKAGRDAKHRNETVGMNKYDKKASDGAYSKREEHLDKAIRSNQMADKATGLNKKRLEIANKYHHDRIAALDNYTKNVAEHGKLRAGFMQVGYHGKNVGSSLKSGAYKVKSGVGRIGNALKSEQTYANIGAGVASIGNQRREFNNRVVSGAKKGANIVRNTPKTVVNTSKKAVNAVKNAPQATKSTAKNIAVRVGNKKDQGLQFARRMNKAASSGYAFTTNRARK